MPATKNLKPYILGDWGTTSCRLYLCRDNAVLDEIECLGAKFTDDLYSEFVKTVQPWIDQYGELSSVLSGMAGSNIGWVETEYVSCPAQPSMLTRKVKQVDTAVGSVFILPGVSTENNLSGNYDVMRGEETQIFGWIETSKREDGILCLPGTHSKWVKIKDRKIVNFTTSFTGELFEVLAQHSILVGQKNLPHPEVDAAFKDGVLQGAKTKALAHILFSVRSNQIFTEYSAKQSQNYLLGLILGHDIFAAKKLFGVFPDVIIGGEGPAIFNLEAVNILGGLSEILSSQDAALKGLQSIYERIIF